MKRTKTEKNQNSVYKDNYKTYNICLIKGTEEISERICTEIPSKLMSDNKPSPRSSENTGKDKCQNKQTKIKQKNLKQEQKNKTNKPRPIIFKQQNHKDFFKTE